MALKEATLFGVVDKVEIAKDRVKEAYKFSQSLGLGKLYVAFSGGKDSVALYGVVKLASEDEGIDLLDYAEFHYSVTGVDPPELVQFIKREFPFVHRDLYTESMWQLIVRNKVPPTRLMRYCCVALKERGGKGRFTATGVRRAESVQRSTRGAFEEIGKTKADGRILFNDNEEDRRLMEHCIPKRQYVVNPIIDWLDEDVWQFIEEQGLPYCKLYDEGFSRLGCIGCPMGGQSHNEFEFERYPKFKDAYIRAFDRMLEARRESGMQSSWKTGQEVFDWWITGKKAPKEETFFD